MPPDPLSEAREALRDALSYHGNREVRARKLVNAAAVLARLDALPARIRLEPIDFAESTLWSGWFYPDAPAARNGALTTPDEPRPPADAEPSDEQIEGADPTEDDHAR